MLLLIIMPIKMKIYFTGNQNFFKKYYYLLIFFGVAVSASVALTFPAIKGRTIFFLAKERIGFPVAIFFNHDAALAMKMGDYYFNGGAYNLDFAERAYKNALAADSEFPFGHYQLARVAFIKGNFTAAIDEIEKELRRYPDHPNAYYVRGLINGYEGRYLAAANDFSRFIEKVPSQWAGYNDLAWIQTKLGDFKGVKKTISLSFERLPYEKSRNPWLWISLGVAYLNTGEYNKSEKALIVAEKIVEKMDKKYFWSAYPGNDPREAENAFRQFRSVLHLNLGIVSEKLGKLIQAETEYRSYLSLVSGNEWPRKEEIKKKINELDARVK